MPFLPIMIHCQTSGLTADRAQVVSVVIDTLEGNSFCSTVLLAPHNCPACEASAVAHKLDARPTDAINLALRTKAPVYFSKVLTTARINILIAFCVLAELFF